MSKQLFAVLRFSCIHASIHRIKTSNFNFGIRFLSNTVICQICDKTEYLQSNPFYEKYAKKLKNLPEFSKAEFKAQFPTLSDEEKLNKPDHFKVNGVQDIQNKDTGLKFDTLDSIMNVDLVRKRSTEEITELWKKHFKTQDVVYSVIPALEYKEIYLKAKDFPCFIYPLPRGKGYEFFVQQWNNDVCSFTPLLSYQTHKGNSLTCLCLKHYTDLAHDKGIVLMVGHPDTSVLTVNESQLLALQMKMYYGIQSALKFNLVRVFNNSPNTFEYRELITEFENYKKDIKSKEETIWT